MDYIEVWKDFGLPIVSAGIGGWFTAWFALGRFRKEKSWERKSVAYTAIFEALFEMEQWFDVHWEAVEIGREMKEGESGELGKQHRAAREKLLKRIASESWILPDECLETISTLKKKLDERHDDWIEDVDAGWGAIDFATKSLRTGADYFTSFQRSRFL